MVPLYLGGDLIGPIRGAGLPFRATNLGKQEVSPMARHFRLAVLGVEFALDQVFNPI
jgi:hypothetical protein